MVVILTDNEWSWEVEGKTRLLLVPQATRLFSLVRETQLTVLSGCDERAALTSSVKLQTNEYATHHAITCMSSARRCARGGQDDSAHAFSLFGYLWRWSDCCEFNSKKVFKPACRFRARVMVTDMRTHRTNAFPLR